VYGHGFTLVSAPPGFGKTTLVTAWLTADTRPVAWLSLDESDNDVVHFIQYLIAALQRVEPGVGKTTSLFLASPQLPPVSALLTPLINDVARLVAVTLVLDDYHIITDARVHDTVRFLLEHLPSSLHLVIISREDPPLPLARFRVRDSITEIRERDLRFSPEETGAFLNQTMNLNLPAGTAEQLAKRTEGWIAALQLAALALQQIGGEGQALVDDFAGDNRYIVDYLTNEVLERQPPSVQDFLRRTSVLDQLSAPLCDAVLEIADSAAILDQLERSNLFLIPLDQKRRWYRYHALFANVLQLTVTAVEQATLHERAADWFIAHAGGLQAVRHALAAAKFTHDYQQAISLILTCRQAFIDQGNLMTVLGWLNALPETALREHPELLIEKAWILVVVGEPARAESLNAVTEADWARLTLANQGRLRLTQSFLALTRGDLAQTLLFAQDAASLLIEPDQVNWRMIALWALAEAQERGASITEAIASLREAVSIGRGTASIMFNIMIELSLATALNEHGERREAVSVAQLALLHYSREPGQAEPLTAILLCRLADLAYETNDLAGAKSYQERAQTLAERLGMDMVTATIEAITAKILVAEGDFDTALLRLQAAKSLSHESLADATWIDAIEGALHLRRADIDAAQKWALQAGLQSDQLPHYLHMERHIVYARLLLAQHALEHASHWLERLDRFAEERGFCRWLISVRILRALAAERLGDSRRALMFMADAVHLAASEGYVRAFLDEPQPVMVLLPKVRSESPAFVDAVLNAATPIFPVGSDEALTVRELEVLGLLAGGLTNAQIAERLVLSPGTVKQHINHIYEKLHVHSRTQAVAKARDSKLIH
jgi:LuxR family maltose regulon positive regulatory protein